jgi:hypothetical protein
LVDYAWSAWSSLGVSGWKPGAFEACVDIEALVLLTGCLGDEDARLRDESIDWCVSNVGLISRSRLAHIVRDGIPNEAWKAYAATLQRATKQRWPGAGRPFDWIASGKSRLPERPQGSTLALRCRGLLGATARSEIVRVLLLDETDGPHDVRDLVSDVRYTKRGVAEALDNLLVASMVRSIRVGNSRRYSLERVTELRRLMAPLPKIRSSQRALCRILWATATATEELSNVSDRVLLVESTRLLHDLEAEIRRVDPKVNLPGPHDAVLEFLQNWCTARCDAVLGTLRP